MVPEISLIFPITCDAGNGAHGALRVVLNCGDLAADVYSRLGGLLGEFLELVGHNGEAFAGLSGARGFDSSVEREKISLLGDGRNEFDHFSNFRAGGAEPADRLVGALGNLHRFVGNSGGIVGVLRDVPDRGAHLFGAGDQRLQMEIQFVDGSQHGLRLRRRFFGGGAHLLADGRQIFGRIGQDAVLAPTFAITDCNLSMKVLNQRANSPTSS